MTLSRLALFFVQLCKIRLGWHDHEIFVKVVPVMRTWTVWVAVDRLDDCQNIGGFFN